MMMGDRVAKCADLARRTDVGQLRWGRQLPKSRETARIRRALGQQQSSTPHSNYDIHFESYGRFLSQLDRELLFGSATAGGAA